MTFVDKDGEEKQVKVPVGMSILEAAHANDIDLEGNPFFYFPFLQHRSFVLIRLNLSFHVQFSCSPLKFH